MGLLFIAEAAGLSMQFLAVSLSAGTRVADDWPMFLSIAFASIGALLLMVAPRRNAIAMDIRIASTGYRWEGWLLVHLAAFGAFCWANLALLAEAEARRHLPGGLLVFWAVLGCTSFVAWLGALAPAGFWFGLLRQERAAVVAAMLAGTLAVLGGWLTQQLWKPLAAGTFWLAHGLLGMHYSGIRFDAQEHLLGTSTFAVRIAPGCSGYEGISLIVVFLAGYLWLFRGEIRFPQAFLLFPIGVLAIWLANVVRIALLIAIGTSVSPEVALDGFHSQAGWIAFVAVAIGLVLVMRRLRLFAIAAPGAVAGEANPLAPALLMPLLVLMGSLMLTSALSAGFDWLYPVRVVSTTIALWCFRHVYLRWDWRPSWQAVAIGVAVFPMWIVLQPADRESGLGQTLAMLPAWESVTWLAFRIVGSVIVVPLAEELAFRGYLLRRLAGNELEPARVPRFTWLSFVVTSLAFGLLHTQWLAGTLAGMAFAGALYRRGRLADAVIAHMTTNGLIALAVLLGGRWSLFTS